MKRIFLILTALTIIMGILPVISYADTNKAENGIVTWTFESPETAAQLTKGKYYLYDNTLSDAYSSEADAIKAVGESDSLLLYNQGASSGTTVGNGKYYTTYASGLYIYYTSKTAGKLFAEGSNLTTSSVFCQAETKSPAITVAAKKSEVTKVMFVPDSLLNNLSFNAADCATQATVAPTVTLTDINKKEVSAGEDGTYSGLYGTYTYTAQLEGYNTVTGQIDMTENNKVIQLDMIPVNSNAVRCVTDTGETLKTIAGEAASTIYYPAVIKQGKDYYKTEQVKSTNYGKTFTEAGVADVVYKKSPTIVYYTEAETALSDGTIASGDFSSGEAVANPLSAITTDTLPAGAYKMTAAGRNINTSGNASIYFTPTGEKNSSNHRAIIYKDSYAANSTARSIAENSTFTIDYQNPDRLQLDYIFIERMLDIPKISIDYGAEKLTGFETNGIYTIDGQAVEFIDNKLSLDEYIKSENSSIQIIRNSSDEKYLDSPAQTLEIPARPQAPADYTVTQPTTSEEKGSISGEGLQYSAKSGDTWGDWAVPPSEIEQGTIFKLRKAASSSAFASAETEEITIDTVASIVNHTVTFNTDGGSEIGSVTVTDCEKVAKPDDPIKTGHTFVKWQLNGADYDFNTAVTGDITLTAVWEINKYNATFDLAGGNINGSAENVVVQTDYNAVPTVPENPARTGYTFAGWFPEVAAIAEDTTYTAQWTENSYTISKNTPENGSVTLSKTSANMGEEITVTVNPSVGYKLASLTVNGETADVKINSYTFTMPAANVEIVAAFERKAVKSINITGASTITKGHTGAYTVTVTAEDDTDVTELYKSDIVWSVTGNSASDTKIEKDAENGSEAALTLDANEVGTDNKITVAVTIGEKVGNKEITVADEPHYHIEVSAVTGGTITLMSSNSVTANSTVTFTVMQSAGYVLKADSVKVNNGEVNVTENNGTYSFTMPAKAVTITAEFTPITYTITKTASQNGSFAVSAENEAAGTTVTISDITPDEGYELDAVTVTKTGDTNTKLTVTDNSFEMPNYHVTVAVTFKKKTYTVTFNVDGQTTEVKVEHGTTAEKKAPQNPTKDGYHFVGWIKGENTDDDVITVWDSITDNGVIYTAKFDENPPVTYTVTITGGEGIENIKLGSTEGQKSGDTYTFANVLAGTYTFDITYEVGYEKADDSVENITVSENKTSETVSAQKKKFTVTFKVDGQADIEVSNVEYGTAPTGAPHLEDTTERHYLGWVKGTDITSDVINLVDELITENTVYTAKYEPKVPQPEKVWLELLPKFKEWLQIEKITDKNKVMFSMSKKDNGAFTETDKFSVYIAVYDEGILQSVRKIDFEESESNTLKASISEPDNENYKVFIWTSKYEPVTGAITSSIVEANKLF